MPSVKNPPEPIVGGLDIEQRRRRVSCVFSLLDLPLIQRAEVAGSKMGRSAVQGSRVFEYSRDRVMGTLAPSVGTLHCSTRYEVRTVPHKNGAPINLPKKLDDCHRVVGAKYVWPV
jgi:hypothetical protein